MFKGRRLRYLIIAAMAAAFGAAAVDVMSPHQGMPQARWASTSGGGLNNHR
jgi:hypothetical protein